MKVAVIGAGFSGLAVTWYLLKTPSQLQIDLFDERPIGEGTSGSSSGLINPYPGKHANKSLYADEALQEAKELIREIQFFSKQKIIQVKGLFKPALNKEQKDRYLLRYKTFENLQWKEQFGYEGLFIPEAISIDPKCYLNALLKGCLEKGVRFIQKKTYASDLSAYDQIIYAGGYQLDFLDSLLKLPVQATKGQMLVCEKSELDTIICGQGHICSVEDTTYLGSTYERDFTDDRVDLEKALCLKEQIGAFFPKAKDLRVIECRSGIRIKRKGHYLPFVGKVQDNIWMITGMGSRGLLYHAYLGNQLSLAILNRGQIDSNFMGLV